MDPEVFDVPPDQGGSDALSTAILDGYKVFDEIIGEAMANRMPEETLVMLTGLSQQPYLKQESSGGKTFYRPHDFRELVKLR